MVGTFLGEKSLKTLSNKVFRFIQQTLIVSPAKIKNLRLGKQTPRQKTPRQGEKKDKGQLP